MNHICIYIHIFVSRSLFYKKVCTTLEPSVIILYVCVCLQNCRICSDCGARTPGNGPSSRWHLNYSVCDSCYQQRNKGLCCPLCGKAYRHFQNKNMMVPCSSCKKWVWRFYWCVKQNNFFLGVSCCMYNAAELWRWIPLLELRYHEQILTGFSMQHKRYVRS